MYEPIIYVWVAEPKVLSTPYWLMCLQLKLFVLCLVWPAQDFPSSSATEVRDKMKKYCLLPCFVHVSPLVDYNSTVFVFYWCRTIVRLIFGLCMDVLIATSLRSQTLPQIHVQCRGEAPVQSHLFYLTCIASMSSSLTDVQLEIVWHMLFFFSPYNYINWFVLSILPAMWSIVNWSFPSSFPCTKIGGFGMKISKLISNKNTLSLGCCTHFGPQTL